MKSKIILAAKALVTLGLLSYLVLSLDFILFNQILARLQLGLFFVVIAVHFLSLVPIEACRLFIAFPSEGGKWPVFARLALFNAFFHNFLPSNLGPSIYTVVYLQRYIACKVELVTRMFLLRLLGFLSLASLVLTYMIYDFTSISNLPKLQVIYVLIGYVLSVSVAVAMLAYALRHTRVAGAILSLLHRAQVVLREVSFRDISMIVLLSIAFHLIRSIAFWGLAYALGIEITWGVAIFLLSANAILLLLPISIGGIGVQEGFLIIGLGSFGVHTDPAITLVFLYRILLLIMGLVGGIAYFVSLRNEPPHKVKGV